MLSATMSRMKRIGKSAFRIALCAILVFQTLWVPNSALAETTFYFRGFGSENVNSGTFGYATSGASVSGGTVTMSPLGSEGEAIGLINLDEPNHDISKSVDLGGLEIDFSTVSSVTLEGENGADNDIPTAKIIFCSSADIGSVISSVTLTKPDSTVAGNVTLSSGAKIPDGTRSIFISLKGTNKTDNNNVVFSGTSLVIRDAGAPSCNVDYNANWTNQDVTLTVTAADSDAGLAGIYFNDAFVSETSPYTFIVSANNTNFSAYAMDLAGKKSDVVTGTLDHIDKSTPVAPTSVPLSTSAWTNTDVYVLMPALGTSSGSPERYVYQIGSGAWADLPDGFAITASGDTTIRVAVEDAAGNRSASAAATASIDKIAPTIGDATITSGSSSAKVDVSATDGGLSAIRKFCYAAGEQTAAYFTTGGTTIVGGTFTVNVGGTYTLYVSDNAGNETLKTISITTAPTFDAVSDITMNEDETRNVPLSVSDAESSLSELTFSVSTSNDALLEHVLLKQSNSAVSLDITPAANQSGGPVTVTVVVEDPSGQKVTRKFAVTVSAVNDDPVAQNDTGLTVTEDGFIEIDVLANDGDTADNDTVSIKSVGDPAHGTTLIVLGKVRYTPSENYSGQDSFTYEITDGNGGTAQATVSITVESKNDAPVAVNDTASTAEDTAVTIDALANDTDVDTKTIGSDESIALVSSANGVHGTTEIMDGKIVYTPETNFNGTDTFTYIITDKAGLTAEASVTVTVSPEADAPSFIGLSDAYTINEDSSKQEITFEIFDVETPEDSLMLQAASMNTELIDQTGIKIEGLGDSDTAVKVLLTPVANQFGDVTLKLTLGDGFETVERTITIHILNVNDAPRVSNDTQTYTEDAAYLDISIAQLLANDTDIEGDTLFFDGFNTNPAYGKIELLNETTLRYTPAKDYDGTASFTYFVSDGAARTLATCTLKAIGVNDAPSITIAETELTGTEDTLITIPFTIQDNESNPADLEVIASSSNDDIVTTDGITIINNGDGTGEAQITPEADANGTLTLTLTVSDGEAQASDNVNLTITPAQDAPVAEDDLIYVRYTTSRNFSVLENDHDVDGEALTVSAYSAELPGTLTFDAKSQTFTYVPRIGENGTSSFTYTITDGRDTDTATVMLDVVTEPHNPVITSIDSRYVNEDGTASGITFNVSDEDVGDTATITVSSGSTTLLPNDAEHIIVNNLGSGNYSLTLNPGADQSGSTSVTVTVTDSTGRTDSTTFYLHVLAQNDAPVAVNDTLNVKEDCALELTLLGNDSDPDGDTIWLSSLTSPSHGYIERSGNTYIYYPYENWSGSDSLTYRVSDGRASTQASVSITVNPVNDNPVAWDDWRTLENTTGTESANINVLANDYDVDNGDVIRTYQIETAPKYGTAEIQSNGTITYTRNQISPDGNGADSFVYSIIDRETATGDYRIATATVHIGVIFTSSLNTYGKSVTCYEDDDPFTIDLSVSNPTPVDYNLTVNTTTTLGTFEVVDNDTVRFIPAANQYGYANITYTVEQIGGGQKDTGTIWLRVYPVNDLPVISSVPSSITMDEDTGAGSTFNVDFSDADSSNGSLYFYIYTLDPVTSAPIPFQASYTVTKTDTGKTVTVKTAENVNGTAKIIVGVSDGMTYVEKTIDLTVTPVDDAPVVSPLTKTINEDSSVTFASPGSDCEVDGNNIVEAIDPDHAPQHGTATIHANRTITYVPDANYFGTDTFYVIETDQTVAALHSAALITIVVNPVNDPPEITDLSYYQTTLEDNAIDVPLTVSDVDNTLIDSEHYTLTSSDETIVKSSNISISHGTDNGMIIHVVPEANAYGTVKIDVVASDGSLSAQAAFQLKIVSVNDIPVAKNDALTVNEVVSTGAEAQPPKTTATMDLLDNDSDVEDGKPKIVSITNVVNGIVTNSGGGNVLVSADGDFSGEVTFTYTVMDRAGATVSATGTLTILALNDPPRAKDDSLVIFEDDRPQISVLTNDSDPEGDTLTIASVTQPTHGTAAINGTKIDYVPVENYFGTDSFTYTVSDGKGGANTATVRITLKPVNDAPTIAKHSTSSGDWIMLEDTTKSFNFVVADAESSVNNLIIKINSKDETLVKTTQITLTTNAAGYKTMTVTPAPNAHGELDVRIWVSDGLDSGEAIYHLTIISVNDAPVVTVPLQTTKEDTLLHASAFATDADNDPVTFAAQSDPAHGTVTVYADGSFDYMPAKDYNGADSFVILADDGNTDNHIGYATVYITVKPDGDAPVARADTITIDEDTASVIPVLNNDSDVDSINGDKISVLRLTTPAHGTAAVADSGILYTPNANYNGSDSFSYTITDLDGKTATATVNVTILPVNDAPIGGDDTATVLEDHAVVIDAVANDDVDETTNPDLEDVTILSVDTPTHGTAVISTDKKTITYTPNENWFSPAGEHEVFYYTAKDSSNKTARFAISVTVTSVNDLPVINPSDLPNVTTAEDTLTPAITFTVSDVETAAGSLTVTATHLNGVLLPAISVSPNAEGACSFTVLPNLNKVGSTTITVKVTDADGGQTSDTFTLTVTPVNDVPKAGDDSYTVAENATITKDVLANDDVDILANNGGDTLTLLSIATPQYGTATIVNNKLYYVPNADRDTTNPYQDVFTYTMKDASGNQCTPTVTVTVTPVNDPPKISAISNVTGILEDAPDGTGDISFNVTDEEDDDNTLTVTATSENTSLFPLGNITITNPTGEAAASLRTVKIVPAANQFGSGTITLTVTDSNGLKATSSFTVTVTSVNDIPDNGDKAFTVVEDVEKQLDVLNNIDPDYATAPDYITITGIATQPSHGTVRIAADGKSVYYKTAQDSNEPDSFQYTIHDAYGNADYTFTVTITVTPVNDAPVITYLGDATYTIYEGTQQNGIPFTVTDVDNVTYAGGSDAVEVTLSAKSSNSLLLINGIHINTLTGNDRTIDLKPYLKWNGSTTVTITVTDPGGLKATTSFKLIVNNVNDVPVAANDSGTIAEDATSTIYVLANDTDSDLLTNPDTEFIRVNTVTDNDPNATITKSSDGKSITVVPNKDYNGPLSFTYTAVDSFDAVSNVATVNLTVLQVNDAPVTQSDTTTTNEDTQVNILVLSNDSDVDMDAALNAHPENESISVVLTGGGLVAPSHGTIATDGTKITYTPTTNYNGPDTFEYYCSDGDTKTKGSVSLTVYQVNDAPVAVANTATIDEDTTTGEVDVLANDTDVDTNTTLNKNVLHYQSEFTITDATVTNSEHGSVTIQNNKLVFTPALNWFGVEVVNYTMSDSHEGSASSTLTVTVNSVNDLPEFTTAPVDMNLSEDGADGTCDIVVNDVETAKSSLSVTVTGTTNPTLVALTDVTVTAGTNGTRTITVNPKLNQNGSAIITLTVDDLTLGTRTVQFTVTVAAVNDAPVADDKTLNINEDATLQTITKSSITSDVDIATNADSLTLSITTAALHGTAGIDASGNITYVPIANFNGTDTFVYTATDKAGATDTGTFTVNIAQVNDAPVPAADTTSTNEDTQLNIFVLSNDSDIDMNALLNANPGAESISVVLTGGGLVVPSHGSISTDGTKITYTPTTNYNGPDTFEYYCSDGDVKTKGTVTLIIYQVNDNPVAVANTTTTNEDTATAEIDVLANDTDVDTGTTLNKNVLHLRSEFSITTATVTNEAHGSVQIINNKLKFTPALNWNGAEVINYTMSDGHEGSASSTLTVTVTPVNDTPVFDTAPENLNLSEDGANGVTTVVVSDIETAAASCAVTVTNSSNPTLIATTDVTVTAGAGGTRTITVNPKDNQNGSSTITLKVDDLTLGTRTITFDVTVAAVNDTPVADDKTLNINEDASLQTITKSSLTSDVDIATNSDVLTLTITTAALHGTAAIDANGNVTYVPGKDFNGVDTFVYTATDKAGATDTGTFTVNIAQVNDAPVTQNDSKTTDEDTATDISVLTNDSDVDMNAALNAHPENESISVVLTGGGLTAPAHGTISTDGTKITYTPSANYNGTDTFDYYCSDGDVTTKGTVNVTIKQVDDSPAAEPDYATIDEDTATEFIDVLANDTDIDLDPVLNQDNLLLRSKFEISAFWLGNTTVGTVEKSDNKIKFTPRADWFGEATIYYSLQDGYGASCITSLTVTVTPVNDVPVFDTAPENLNLSEDGANGVTTVVVSDVETAAASCAVTVTNSSNPSLIATTDVTVEAGTGGTCTITINPKDNQNGTATITLKVDDLTLGTRTITFDVTVASDNDTPVADDKTLNINEDASLQTITKSSLTSDVDIATNTDVLTLTITTAALHGTAGIDANGNVTYVPGKDFNGVDTFVYTATDKAGATDTGTFTVNIAQVNDAPVTQNDSKTTDEETATDISVLTNDSDVDMNAALNAHPENESISVVLTGGGLTAPSHGSIATDGTKITYTPRENYNGADTFEYYCSDGDVKTKAEVTITVTAVNDTPVADDKTLNINEDASLQTITKSSITSDVDIATNADVLTLTITTAALHGTAAIDANGNVTYLPGKDFNGVDTFVYSATDKDGATDTGTFTVNIAQVNDVPVTQNDSKTTNEDTAIDISVLTNDSDVDMDAALNAHPENESISVVLTGGGLVAPSHGTITTDGTKITYTPSENYNGTDSFNYYCTDGDVSTKGTVYVTIKQVDDSPIAKQDTATIDEDTATDYIDVMANDTDVDLDPTLNEDNLLLRSMFSISAAWLSDESVGTVDLTNNKIKFTPTLNWNGDAIIYYSLQDGYGASCITSLKVTVTPVNDLPVYMTGPVTLNLAEDGADGTFDIVVDDVETAEKSLIVTVTNTTNPTLIALTDVTVEAGTGGTRTITVNPKDNQFGDALITLILEDADGGKTEATFVVHVASVNDAPIAVDKTLNINEDANIQTIAKTLLTSDVDIATNADVLTLTITTAALHGTAAIDANGNITYKPGKDFNGVDTFVYTATDKDGATDTGTFTINIAQVNDAPVVQNDNATTDEDVSKDIYVLTNDSDVDMDAALNAHPEDESIIVVINDTGLTAPSHGTIANNGTKITYTPNKDFNGTDTFDYYCYDGVEKVKATVSVTIKQVNDNPVANADSTSTDEDKPVSYNVLENDADVDTIAALNENDLHSKSDFAIDSCNFYGDSHGTLKIEGASILFTPDRDFYGTQVIKYVLNDGNGGTAIGTLTILVGSENDAPVAKNDSMSAEEDNTASVKVLENDTDVDTGDTKTFVGFLDSTSGLGGTFTTDENGDVSFAPDANYNGSFDITYQMRDTAGLTSSAKLTVTITPVNDKPVANDKAVQTGEDTAKGIDVSSLIGDVDIATNADTLQVTVAASGEPAHGTVSVSGTTITYTPTKDFNGTDEIVYTVTDSKGETDTGKLSITVNAVNDAPVAANDTKTTQEDYAVEILALANDGDIDTDETLNATPAAEPYILSVGDGAHGTATTDGTKITYTPDENYNGTDTISYVLTDGLLNAKATITITITQVNDDIQALDDKVKTNDEDKVTVDVLANDWDVDTDTKLNKDELHLRDSFVITAVGTPAHGKAAIASGKIDYTPDDRYAGADSFTYTISDGHGTTSTATVNITVISVNDPPVIKVVASPKEGDRAGTGSKVTVNWTGFDIDGDALTYTLEYYDGKTWHPIADNLTDTTYVFAIPDSLASTDGLKFRVNARDSEFTSDYGYSGAMKVDKDAPTGTIVTMQTADGRTYTAGTWTNQTVTVVANSSVDASKVTYYYDMDGGTSAAGTGMDVTAGVHTVNIKAVDEYGNTTIVGGYLARVDKQQPAVPEIRESISGGSVVLTLTLQTDPGGSGNDKLTLPDGTTVKATGNPTFSAAKNGTYNFTLTDIAGNRRVFSYTVTNADTTKPVITLASGAYRIGNTTVDPISAMLTFTDAESELVTREYLISTSSTASGAYHNYTSALQMSDPGTYYIHAYAKNAFGLTTYQTFGPFIIEAPTTTAATPSPTPTPKSGDVVVTKEDIEEIPGDTVSIRLPGQDEWSETLTLEGVGPGTYLVEAMDADGNVRTVEVHVTVRDIIARSIRSAGDDATTAAIAISALALVLIALLVAGHNVTIVVVGTLGASTKKLRTLRRIKFRKKELIVKLDAKQLIGGEYCDFTISKALSKQMRGNTVVLTMRGREVLRTQIPEDINEAFRRKILIEQ